MRYAKAIVVLLAIPSASAMAGNETPKIGDEQMACVAATTKEYLTTNAQLVLKATANGTVMSEVDPGNRTKR
jgi:hypothetical protein